MFKIMDDNGDKKLSYYVSQNIFFIVRFIKIYKSSQHELKILIGIQ